MPSRVEYDRRLRQRLDALGPAPRAELLHVLTLPDFERADRIGEFRFAHNFSCPPRRGDRYEAMGICRGRRRVTFAGALTALPASASTTLLVSMTLAEPTVNLNHPCPVHGSGFCGSGHVTPFGQATETIEFGAGCGGSCDLRTIHLEDGTIVLEETLSDPLCPGSCQPNIAGPFSGTITDVIVDGTGLFEGATGELEGTVRAAGQQSRVKLSGFITFGP